MMMQSDIIRALVNKNCTDESIMSMALSPGCTPPRLFERLTEAEQFDLALDISMKIGVDVSPIWKTWAMRCLKNHNFAGARDKFKHCFSRLRSNRERTSSASRALLSEILNELKRLEERPISLADQIEAIKSGDTKVVLGRSHQLVESKTHVRDLNEIGSKPRIFAECQYYLGEYGGLEDEIRFYVEISAWDNAVKLLMDNQNRIDADRFFINEIFLHAASIGQLSRCIATFTRIDPGVNFSFKYFKAIYNVCHKLKRFSILYYIQTAIRDHVGAAQNQISNFFLRKPTFNYKELSHRTSHLMEARLNYQTYLEKMSSGDTRPSVGNSLTLLEKSSLFTEMTQDQVRRQMKLIDFQLEITSNFAINEVAGCTNDIEIVYDGEKPPKDIGQRTSPVTLFDINEERRVFLAALTLIYFDRECKSNFSISGLALANEFIKCFNLNKLNVFKTAMRIVLDDESCDIGDNARLLIERLKEDYFYNQKASVHVRNTRPSIDNIPTRISNSLRHDKVAPSSPVSLSPSSTSSFSSSPLSAPSLATHMQKETSSNHSPRRDHPICTTYNVNPKPKSPSMVTLSPSNTQETVRMLCDEVIQDAIGYCHEPDYKMELAKLLSCEAKIELYIGLGKLSNAQSLAFNMNRPDYVNNIIEEASKLNQNHVKTVCQLWLAKHDTS